MHIKKTVWMYILLSESALLSINLSLYGSSVVLVEEWKEPFFYEHFVQISFVGTHDAHPQTNLLLG